MTTASNPATRTHDIENLLWIWLAAGAVACLLFPPLRGRDPLLGWMPFWLIVVPVIDLGLLRRQSLLAAARTAVIDNFLVRRARRRHPARQARRLRRDQSLMPRRFFSMRRKNSSMMRRYKSSPR
jgi:hypothetical protein